MNYKGTVTALNTKICQFTVDSKVEVYAAFLFLNNTDKLYFPSKGQEILIEGAHLFKPNNIFLVPSSALKCNKKSKCDVDTKTFIDKFIVGYKLGGLDLVRINTLIKILSVNFTHEFLMETAKTTIHITDVVLKLIVNTCIDYNDQEKEVSLKNTVIPSMKIQSPSDLKLVDDGASYKSNDWNFGVYSSVRREFMFGYVTISKLNVIEIQDVHHKMMMILVNNKTDLNLDKKYVIVKRFNIFTEVMRWDNATKLEYLYCDAEDVTVLDVSVVVPVELMVGERAICEMKILHKGTVMVGINKHRTIYQCWLHCLVISSLESNYNNEQVLFLLCHEGIRKSIHFRPGDVYQLKISDRCPFWIKFNNRISFSTSHTERFFPKIPCFDLPEEATYTLLRQETPTLYTVTEVTEMMNVEDYWPLYSFEGVIQRKNFVEPFESSKRQQRLSAEGCGTPGLKVHQLVLGIRSGRSVKIYLDYWDSLLTPLGLVPEMRVSVHAVIKQSNYFKNTAFTRIEPLEYAPAIRISTCYNVADSSARLYCHQGLDARLPNNVVIWTRLGFLRLTHVEFDKQHDGELSCTMQLDVRNENGRNSTLTCRDMAVFRQLTHNTSDREWRLLSTYLSILGSYCFSAACCPLVFEDHIARAPNRPSKIRGYLDMYFSLLSIRGAADFDVKCRFDRNANAEWLCLQVNQPNQCQMFL